VGSANQLNSKVGLGIAFIVAAVIVWIVPNFVPSSVDRQALALLLATLAGFALGWGVIFKDAELSNRTKTGPYALYIVPLLAVLVISTWTAARVLLVYMEDELGTGSVYAYQVQIFNIVGWVLVPFLVFTLIQTLQTISSREREPHLTQATGAPDPLNFAALIRVIMIALTIGILLTVPRLTDAISYAQIPTLPEALLVEIGSMIGLFYVYKHFEA